MGIMALFSNTGRVGVFVMLFGILESEQCNPNPSQNTLLVDHFFNMLVIATEFPFLIDLG
jgi:hypothetical protein